MRTPTRGGAFGGGRDAALFDGERCGRHGGAGTDRGRLRPQAVVLERLLGAEATVGVGVGGVWRSRVRIGAGVGGRGRVGGELVKLGTDLGTDLDLDARDGAQVREAVAEG